MIIRVRTVRIDYSHPVQTRAPHSQAVQHFHCGRDLEKKETA
jgi:hypothetical protein